MSNSGKMKRITTRQSSVAPSTISSTSRKTVRTKHKDQTTDTKLQPKPSKYREQSSTATELNLFPLRQIEDIMVQALTASEFANNPEYDSACGVDCVLTISDDIRSKVRNLLQNTARERHKIVVNVLAGSTNPADMAFVSRCVWNTDTDTYLETKLERPGRYLIAVLYAVEQD